MSESLLSKPDFVSRLIRNKKFRDSYSYELVRTGIPFQMRALREQRGWTQADLAEAIGKPRSVITRLESPGYGKLSLKSLFEIASGFDVGLMVKFVPFSRLLREYEDVSSEALACKGIFSERERLQRWANAKAAEAVTDLAADQMQLGFDETNPTDALTSTIPSLEPAISGRATNKVISIKTRRPLQQRKKVQARPFSRLRRTG
jgi:transcriptional regulator with XRE-family HTH domain